jgi:C1A family cysteine protease
MFHALKKFFNKHGHYGLIRNRKVEEEFCSANPYSFGDDVIPPVDINLIPVSMGINKWLKTENQQQLSSCVGHGSTSAAEIAFYRETRLVEQFNRMFAYRTAQMIDGITGDRGAMITGAGKASMKFGHCLESIWPYVNRYQTKLPAECFKDAEKRKIRMYKALRSYDDVLRWLVHGIGGVHIGIDWNSSMDNYDSKGRITKYSQGGGGHALCLGDWNKEFLDDKGQPFIEMFNSWGVNWGVGGRAYIHPKVVDYWCKAEVVIGYSDMDGEAVKPRTYDWSTFSM